MNNIYTKHDIDRDIARSFKTLANPARLDVLVHILQEACECEVSTKGVVRGGNCVTALCKKLSLPQSTVSGHVKELMQAGLIEARKQGKKIFLFGSTKAAKMFKDFGEYVVKEVEGHSHKT